MKQGRGRKDFRRENYNSKHDPNSSWKHDKYNELETEYEKKENVSSGCDPVDSWHSKDPLVQYNSESSWKHDRYDRFEKRFKKKGRQNGGPGKHRAKNSFGSNDSPAEFKKKPQNETLNLTIISDKEKLTVSFQIEDSDIKFLPDLETILEQRVDSSRFRIEELKIAILSQLMQNLENGHQRFKHALVEEIKEYQQFLSSSDQ